MRARTFSTICNRALDDFEAPHYAPRRRGITRSVQSATVGGDQLAQVPMRRGIWPAFLRGRFALCCVPRGGGCDMRVGLLLVRAIRILGSRLNWAMLQ